MADKEKVLHGLDSCGFHDGINICEVTECPYRDNKAYCVHELAHDAGMLISELLKAQEPRVMTLDEALGGEECWVEYPNGGCGYADCYLSYTTDGADIYRTMQHDFNVPLANYGKTWRCWTSRPTEEQREAAKWG